MNYLKAIMEHMGKGSLTQQITPKGNKLFIYFITIYNR